MPTGTSLTNLLVMVKAELGFSTGNTVSDTELGTLLSNKQKWLAAAWDWPFLMDRWSVSVGAGSRYVNLPTTDMQSASATINKERGLIVESWFSSFWQTLEYGIGAEEFVYSDSDAGETQDPIQRWCYNGASKFEVWPMPATAQTVKFTGQKTVGALATGSDTADLDDMLLVYFVAAEKLKRLKQEDWIEKLTLAKERFLQLRSQYPQRTQECILGGGHRQDEEWRRVLPIVTVAGS